MIYMNEILAECVKLNEFDHEILAYLVNVDKLLRNTVLNQLKLILTKRWEQCSKLCDNITLDQFCLRYIDKQLNPGKKLVYDYCDDCYAFNKINDGICANGCIITCCNITNVIPRLMESYQLNCDCKTIIGTRYMNKCSYCSNIIIKNNVKCANCNIIPLRCAQKLTDAFESKYKKYKKKYKELQKK